jgi:hypothetical protein
MPAVESNPEADDTAPEEQPKLSPLEAVRAAQAKRTPPPGASRQGGRGKGRGVNPAAPRHYNRHK